MILLLLLSLLLLLLLLLLLCHFIGFGQAILNTEIFLLGELQLVATCKRVLSPYMSKTFLSILALPNKTDFCTIPTFNLVPSVSIHALKPLLMHPRAPTSAGTTSTFFSDQSLFSSLSLFKFYCFSIFLVSFSCILQSSGIATSMMVHDFAFLSTKIKLGLLASITLSH